MTLQYVLGDILKAGTDAVVNPVNCVGVMGAGLAKQFKDKYPNMFEDYKNWCGTIAGIGILRVYERFSFDRPLFIINFPTKYHWKDPSRLEYIESGLATLVFVVKKLGIKSVAIPKLGCGLGGLEWKDVNSLFKKYLFDLDVQVIVCGENV